MACFLSYKLQSPITFALYANLQIIALYTKFTLKKTQKFGKNRVSCVYAAFD